MAFKFFTEMRDWLDNEYHCNAVTCINNWINCGDVENPEDYDQLYLAMREDLNYDLWLGHWNSDTRVIDVTQYMDLTLNGIAATIAGLTQPAELLAGCKTFMENYFPIDKQIVVREHRFTDRLVHLCTYQGTSLYQNYDGALLYVRGHEFPAVAESYEQLKFMLPESQQYVIQELLYHRYGLQGGLKAVTLSEFL